MILPKRYMGQQRPVWKGAWNIVGNGTGKNCHIAIFTHVIAKILIFISII